ncbi:MAG: metal-dependent hydrolase [Gammaproteobacteria bacterium]
MASAFAHALVAYTGTKINPIQVYPWRTLSLAIIWSIVPDIDSIGFFFGIPYGDVFGHRGFTHSIFFAFICSSIIVTLFFSQLVPSNTHNNNKLKIYLVLFFTLIMASHGVLDAMTNGGLGIAFFAPFDNSRYFFPWRPIYVSPIGIKSFFSEWGIRVLISEAIWIGIACGVILISLPVFKLLRSK